MKQGLAISVTIQRTSINKIPGRWRTTWNNFRKIKDKNILSLWSILAAEKRKPSNVLCCRIDYGDAIVVGEHGPSSTAVIGLLCATACWTKFLQSVLEKPDGSAWGRGITLMWGRWVTGRGEREKPVCSCRCENELFIRWRPCRSDAGNFCAADAILVQGGLISGKRKQLG